ncbi:MAG: DEAD/DEAH box helicase family protein, partial [Pontiellaceae bacterium]|nr:DEAD/DEAH box helicase family protein [Pontiellaceae bacterium]
MAEQSGHYAENLPAFIQSITPGILPFLYESTGIETFFRDERDPEPRSRRLFSFHRPETLAALAAEPDTLRRRLADMPVKHPLPVQNLRACQVEGITNLEESFASAHPRALVQMATGAGKTYTACSFTYRLIKHAGAKRVLFLVDRANLGRQAMSEFQQFVAPDTGRKFTEVYNVQHLTSSNLDSVARVTICTVQRLYSILRGEELDEDIDEKSGYELAAVYEGGSGVSPLNSGTTQSRDGSATLNVSYNPETKRYEKSETLIQEFRTSPQLRIAVTVDMIATGTDIKPLECLLFLRDTKSRTYFEQMKGRGTRVLTATDLQAVSGADALAKTHFVIVDAVGVCESDKTDSRPLERQRTVAFDKLLLGIALGKRDEDTLTTLAGRLARLDREISREDAKTLTELAGGKSLSELSNALLAAVNPDKVEAASRRLLQDRVAELGSESYGSLQVGYFDPAEPVTYLTGDLPHWRQENVTYFVTFR